METHRKLLSSPYTVYWKFVFFSIWIIGFGAGAIAAGISTGDAKRWIFPFVWIVGSVWLASFALRLRRVTLCGDMLHVSTYLREIALPLPRICRITQSYMSRPQTITLHADYDTALSRKFVFVATGWPRILSRHPLAVQLEQLVAQHRSRSHVNT